MNQEQASIWARLDSRPADLIVRVTANGEYAMSLDQKRYYRLGESDFQAGDVVTISSDSEEVARYQADGWSISDGVPTSYLIDVRTEIGIAVDTLYYTATGEVTSHSGRKWIKHPNLEGYTLAD